jgi:hypothetical protein
MNQSQQAADTAMQKLADSIQQKGQTAVTNAQTVGDDILKVFTDLADKMEQAGNTMMQRLAAGITAGGASAVAAAKGVAAQIKAQFPSSPAKEGPLSGSGDPQISGGKIMTRLGAGIDAQAAQVIAKLQKVTDQANKMLSSINGGSSGGTVKAEDGTNVPSSFYDEVSPAYAALHGLKPGQHVVQGGTQSDSSMSPQQLYAAVAAGVAAGMPDKLRIEDDGRNGVARLGNRGNRAMGRQ